MPLIIEGGRVPPRWADKKRRALGLVEDRTTGAEVVRVALINNMPDGALEDTEMQFFELLEAAAGEMPLRVKLHSLSSIPRGVRGQQHIGEFYFAAEDLWDEQFDCMIMTGAEPKQLSLRSEPYWAELAAVLDWAERDTTSTVLSCLAAHAAILYSDGINRCPLSDKQFGVFTFTKVVNHPLFTGTGRQIRFPHSRWHEVRAEALLAAGYCVLTQSDAGGVCTFVKKKKRSLFLHFQGHPEYMADTLLREYRRDIGRFIRGERATYPTIPKYYFDAASTKLAAEFQDYVLSNSRAGTMESFPEAIAAGVLRKTWHLSAIAIYRNWLRYVVSNRPAVREFIAVKSVLKDPPQKQSALR